MRNGVHAISWEPQSEFVTYDRCQAITRTNLEAFFVLGLASTCTLYTCLIASRVNFLILCMTQSHRTWHYNMSRHRVEGSR
jgi:hypothetical protein